MDLEHAINHVLALTGEMTEALAAGHLEQCSTLLPRRGDAMAAFQAAHEAADAAEREACRTILQVLSEADGRLREQAGHALDATALDMRQRAGANPQYRAAADGPMACVDRKA